MCGFLLMKLVVLLIFQILRHNDVITINIENMILDLTLEYQNSKCTPILHMLQTGVSW